MKKSCEAFRERLLREPPTGDSKVRSTAVASAERFSSKRCGLLREPPTGDSEVIVMYTLVGRGNGAGMRWAERGAFMTEAIDGAGLRCQVGTGWAECWRRWGLDGPAQMAPLGQSYPAPRAPRGPEMLPWELTPGPPCAAWITTPMLAWRLPPSPLATVGTRSRGWLSHAFVQWRPNPSTMSTSRGVSLANESSETITEGRSCCVSLPLETRK